MDIRRRTIMKIEGTAALITGGGRGLGAALGAALARRGARVALAARSRDEVEEVAASIRAAGGEAHAFVADLGAKDAIYPLVAAAAAAVGPIDIVVNNASTLGPVPLRELAETDCEDLERALAVNLVGPFRLTKALVGGMLLRRRGAVVSITSDAATNAYPTWGAYGASKAALEQLARVWAAELDGTGVRFLTVDPGEMDTRMHAEAMPDADRATLADPRDVAERIARQIAELP
jgi:NAD(P)-dependent dehydrogenase (short-subunit alcohol dehydrogenase family)